MAKEVLDVAIVGAGPAGLSASLYLARAGLKCAAFSSGPFGGTLVEIGQLANYPGFEGRGQLLADTMKKQAQEAGARIAYGECTEVRRVESATSGAIGKESKSERVKYAGARNDDPKAPHQKPSEVNGLTHESEELANFVLMIDGSPVYARTVLIASGSEPKTLNFTPSKPVSYCALCDGDLAKEKNVVVVGGADSAVQEAMYLAGLAKNVTIITHSALKAQDCLQKRVESIENIEIIENLEPTAEILDKFDWVFVYIGKKPATGCLTGFSEPILSEWGYVITGAGENLHETAIPGIFAAGDVRANTVNQVVTAAGDGVAAAIEIINLLK